VKVVNKDEGNQGWLEEEERITINYGSGYQL
jgi:hypothetical protein